MNYQQIYAFFVDFRSRKKNKTENTHALRKTPYTNVENRYRHQAHDHLIQISIATNPQYTNVIFSLHIQLFHLEMITNTFFSTIVFIWPAFLFFAFRILHIFPILSIENFIPSLHTTFKCDEQKFLF